MSIERVFAIILGTPIIIIIEIIRFIKAKKTNTNFWSYKELALVILYFYIIALVTVTLLPFRTFLHSEPTANIVPVFNTIRDMVNTSSDMKSFMMSFWIINILGNLLLLVPLAIIVPIIFEKCRSIKSIVLLCFFVSVTIEFIQYISMYLGNARAVDIDDVILNTLGAIIGFTVFKLINKRILKNI